MSSKLQDNIVQDLKAAMLGRDVLRTSVLRSLKSAFTYAMVAPGANTTDGLDDDAVTVILAKEAKKRQESADSYLKAGQSERADGELAEKAIIQAYLPAVLDEDQLNTLIEEVLAPMGDVSPSSMGPVIGQVKAKAGPSADGALIARLVKDRLLKERPGK